MYMSLCMYKPSRKESYKKYSYNTLYTLQWPIESVCSWHWLICSNLGKWSQLPMNALHNEVQLLATVGWNNSLHAQVDICLPSLTYISMLNIAAVWIIKPSGGSISGPGPYIFSNVTTPIGQLQPSPEQNGYINVLVSQSDWSIPIHLYSIRPIKINN